MKPYVRNSALGYASVIYLDAGIVDTAYMYAHEIVESDGHAPKEVGYQVLLSPRLRGMIAPDTIDRYLSEYRSLLEGYYEGDKVQLAMDRQNMYDYTLHVREKSEAME